MRITWKALLAYSIAALSISDYIGAQPPAVSHVVDGVNGGETLLICGDGFNQAGLKIERWHPPQPSREDWPDAAVRRESLERALAGGATPPTEPEGRLNGLRVTEMDQHTCAARLPVGGYLQVQAIYVQTADGKAAPRVINRPRLWWASPELNAAGELVRVFGRNLFSQYGGGRCAWLRDAQGSLRQLDTSLPRGVQPGYDGTLTRPYEIDVRLPEDLPPGVHEVFVHNGSGGDWGWSQPLPIQVRELSQRSPVVIRASEFGAIPNDNASDSAALANALQAAAENTDGGFVQLDAGVYHLSANLRLPPQTTLRGVSKTATTIATLNDAPITTPFPQENFPDQDAGYYKAVTGVTPMIWLPATCGLQQLTVRGAPDTLNILIGTRNGPGDGISVNDCVIINRNPVWFPGGKYRFPGNCVLIAGATDGLTIQDCKIEGSCPITSMMQLLRRATIVGNTLTAFPPGRTDCAAFRKPLECIIEDNYCLNAKRGLVIQPQGMAVHNLVANNRVEHIERGGNAGEVELWEGGTVVIGGNVKTADRQSLTGDNVLWESVDKAGKRRDLQGEALAGYVCLITKGRGLGQYRFVESLDGDTLRVNRPWDLPPGAGAEFVVTTTSIENLILNNTDRDGDAGMQIWGGCIANVISGHISEDTEGIILHAADRRKEPGSLARTQKCWFNELRNCRFERGSRLQFQANRRPEKNLNDSGALVFGNTVRHCLWGDAPRLPHQNQWYAFWERKNIVQNDEYPNHHCAIRLAVKGGYVGDPDDAVWDRLTPAVSANVIERNFIDSGWPIGIYEARSARGNIIPESNKILSDVDIVRIAESTHQ